MEMRAPYYVGSSGFDSQFSQLSLNAATLKRFNEGFEPPAPSEVRALIRYLGLTGSQVAAFVGVKNNRTVRKWQEAKDTEKSEIQYSSWRLLLLRAGLICGI